MRQHLLILAAALIAAPAAALPVCPIANGQVFEYDIVRQGDVIGRHTLRFSLDGADLTLTVSVEASVRVLGVRVYHYEHHGTERWRGGQMVSVASHTVDDGSEQRVDAAFDTAARAWRGTHGLAPGAAPLMATSLWNSQTLAQTRLLDYETGEVVAVHPTAAAAETVQVGERSVAATRAELGGAIPASASYDARGCWVRAVLTSPLDGSMIEVRLR